MPDQSTSSSNLNPNATPFSPTRPPPLKSNKRNQSSQTSSPDFFTDLFQTLMKALSDTKVLIVIGIVGFILFSHLDDPTKSPIYKALDSLVTTNKNFEPLVTFIKSKIKFFEALAIFLPVIISIQGKNRTMAIVLVFVWLLIADQYSILQYMVQSITLFLFFKMKSPGHRIFVVFLCFSSFYYLASAPKDQTTTQLPHSYQQQQQQYQYNPPPQQGHRRVKRDDDAEVVAEQVDPSTIKPKIFRSTQKPSS